MVAWKVRQLQTNLSQKVFYDLLFERSFCLDVKRTYIWKSLERLLRLKNKIAYSNSALAGSSKEFAYSVDPIKEFASHSQRCFTCLQCNLMKKIKDNWRSLL